VAGVISHLSSFARFAAQRRSREAADASVMHDLSRAALGLPAGLQLQWLGVAGYRLTYQGHTLYVDPYLSRVALGDVLRSRPARVNPDLYERYLAGEHGTPVGILVGHTHFDHAIDVPALAARFDTKVYGSDSLAHLMALHAQSERAVRVHPHQTYELGPFTVRFVPSLHSKLLLGYRVPFDGELTCEHLDALSPAAYRCGEVYGIRIEVAGTSFYHQGSANLIDSQLQGVDGEIFLAGIAGRSFTRGYWPRILTALSPRLVIASHFDDFFRALSDPVGFSTNVNLAAFPEEIAAVSGDIAVAAMQPMQTISG
jgi:L-ascorbate metabolism protein UlaG (beta-lactamase superfamily)